MRKPTIWTLVFLVVLLGGIFGYKAVVRAITAHYMAQFTPPPAIISAAHAQEQRWPVALKAIGTLKAIQGIALTSEIAGRVAAIHFQSGQRVTQEQPLLQLDDQVEQADLKRSQARLTLAELQYQREKALLGKQAIAQTRFDETVAARNESAAAVEQIQARLAKKTLLAPFAGQVGIRQVDQGDYLSPGTTITHLQRLDQLWVDFSLTEQQIPLVATGQPVTFRVAAYPKRTFTGQIAAVDVKLDDNTRNIQVRALFANSEGLLLPGMFAHVDVIVDNHRTAITVPDTAIDYTLHGDVVYLIETTGDASEPVLTVKRVLVQVGEERGGRVAIAQGIQANDRVVTAGQLKLHNGAQVRIAEQ